MGATRKEIGRLSGGLLCAALLQLASASAGGQEFDFDSGQEAGWTHQVYTSTADLRSGAARWEDDWSHPFAPGAEPLGNRYGAIAAYYAGSDFSGVPAGEWVRVQFDSPDLGVRPAWQGIESFSVQLQVSNADRPEVPPISYNLYVTVYDHDEGRERLFPAYGNALPLGNGDWTRAELDVRAALDGADPAVVNYDVLGVHVIYFLESNGTWNSGGADQPLLIVDDVIGCTLTDIAACPRSEQIFDEHLPFLGAAGVGDTLRYGFEVHGLSEDRSEREPSPVLASDFDGHFDVAYTKLDGFNVTGRRGAGCGGRAKMLYTSAVENGGSYTLTFSNFGGTGEAITAFGLWMCDFAANLSGTVLYDTGTQSGTLLSVTRQSPYTEDFVGVVVDPADAFTSITLTFDDNDSGEQYFDRVYYTPVP